MFIRACSVLTEIRKIPRFTKRYPGHVLPKRVQSSVGQESLLAETTLFIEAARDLGYRGNAGLSRGLVSDIFRILDRHDA